MYKGKLYNGKVAAKRVLAACFSIARKVELLTLRESDEHQNVVKYICMKHCHKLRYIPLELCVDTLQVEPVLGYFIRILRLLYRSNF